MSQISQEYAIWSLPRCMPPVMNILTAAVAVVNHQWLSFWCRREYKCTAFAFNQPFSLDPCLNALLSSTSDLHLCLIGLSSAVCWLRKTKKKEKKKKRKKEKTIAVYDRLWTKQDSVQTVSKSAKAAVNVSEGRQVAKRATNLIWVSFLLYF